MTGEIEGDKPGNEEEKPRKRRDTQDRDERLRRAKLKRQYQKQKEALNKKFATKIEFKDFLRDEDDTNEKNEGTDGGSMQKRQKKAPYIKSSKSAYDRFTFMLSRRKEQSNNHNDETLEAHDDQGESTSKESRSNGRLEEREDEMGGDAARKKHKSFFDADEIVSEQEGDDFDDGDDDGDNDGDDGDNDGDNDDCDGDNNNLSSIPSNFQWFFNSLSELHYESNKNSKKIKYTKSILPSSGGKVYHFIQPGLELPADIKTLADFPGLPKLWKSRSSIKLPPVGMQIYTNLSFLFYVHGFLLLFVYCFDSYC